jgi:hypothetical protein
MPSIIKMVENQMAEKLSARSGVGFDGNVKPEPGSIIAIRVEARHAVLKKIFREPMITLGTDTV